MIQHEYIVVAAVKDTVGNWNTSEFSHPVKSFFRDMGSQASFSLLDKQSWAFIGVKGFPNGLEKKKS